MAGGMPNFASQLEKDLYLIRNHKLDQYKKKNRSVLKKISHPTSYSAKLKLAKKMNQEPQTLPGLNESRGELVQPPVAMFIPKVFTESTLQHEEATESTMKHEIYKKEVEPPSKFQFRRQTFSSIKRNSKFEVPDSEKCVKYGTIAIHKPVTPSELETKPSIKTLKTSVLQKSYLSKQRLVQGEKKLGPIEVKARPKTGMAQNNLLEIWHFQQT